MFLPLNILTMVLYVVFFFFSASCHLFSLCTFLFISVCWFLVAVCHVGGFSPIWWRLDACSDEEPVPRTVPVSPG